MAGSVGNRGRVFVLGANIISRQKKTIQYWEGLPHPCVQDRGQEKNRRFCHLSNIQAVKRSSMANNRKDGSHFNTTKCSLGSRVVHSHSLLPIEMIRFRKTFTFILYQTDILIYLNDITSVHRSFCQDLEIYLPYHPHLNNQFWKTFSLNSNVAFSAGCQSIDSSGLDASARELKWFFFSPGDLFSNSSGSWKVFLKRQLIFSQSYAAKIWNGSVLPDCEVRPNVVDSWIPALWLHDTFRRTERGYRLNVLCLTCLELWLKWSCMSLTASPNEGLSEVSRHQHFIMNVYLWNISIFTFLTHIFSWAREGLGFLSPIFTLSNTWVDGIPS